MVGKNGCQVDNQPNVQNRFLPVLIFYYPEVLGSYQIYSKPRVIHMVSPPPRTAGVSGDLVTLESLQENKGPDS